MRIDVVTCVGALLCGSLVVGCVQEERRVPVAAPAEVRPATAPQAIVVTRSPGVTEAQQAPPPPPVVNQVIVPPSPPEPSADAPDVQVAPPAGVEEAQPPLATVPDARNRTAAVVAVATQQIDRLRRMEGTTTTFRHEDVDAALGDLGDKREKVLQDLRELELEPPMRTSAIRSELDRDIRALKKAVTRSYAIAPPPGQGLPQPSPLPPSQLPENMR